MEKVVIAVVVGLLIGIVVAGILCSFSAMTGRRFPPLCMSAVDGGSSLIE
jgi:hypothetical protein